MARWDILNGDRVRESEAASPREEHPKQSKDTSVSVGRGPTDSSSANTPERPERPGQSSISRTPHRRAQHRDRGRTYSLRSSEVAAISDIGMFRTVDVRDLARFVYAGSESRTDKAWCPWCRLVREFLLG